MNDAGTGDEVGRLGRAVLDAVGTVVVGKRDALELVLAGILAGGHVLLEDLPGLGKTLTARSLRPGARHRLPPAAVHPRPAARRRHRLVPLRPAQPRLHLPAGPDLHQPAARRRDQPDAAEDPVGAAGGDAGEAGLGRGHHLPAGRRRSTCWPPPTRSSTRAPTRCPRRSSTGSCCGSRSATRSRDEEWEVLRRRMARRREEAAARRRWSTRDTLLAMQARAGGRGGGGLDRPVHRRPDRRHPRAPAGAGRRLARAARWRCCCCPGPGRRCAGRDYVIPEDVKAVAVPALAHRITLRPEMWLRRVDPASWSPRCWRQTPAPASGALPSYAGRRTAPVRPVTGPTVGTAHAARRPSRAAGGSDAPSGPARVRAVAPTRALGRAVLLTGLLLIAGAARPASTWSCWPRRSRSAPRWRCWRRPRRGPQVGMHRGDEPLVEGATLPARVDVGNPDPVALRPGGGAAARCPAASTRRRGRPARTRSPSTAGQRRRPSSSTGQRPALGPAPARPGGAHAVAADGLLVVPRR